MSAIAIALHKAGWKVTGSDKGFFPPVSDELNAAGISYYAGYHPEEMEIPDLIVAGAASGTENPEVSRARELGIDILSYPELLAQYFVKENSLVVAGTWGKTTSSALLAHILTEANMNPSYFVGGIPVGMDAGALTKASAWSVLEGDEYKSSPTDKRPKFAHYSPTHLLLTSVSWDHADVYPSEDHYFAAFEKLVSGIPERGLIVACIDNPGVRKVLDHARCKVVTYSKNDESKPDYQYIKVGESKAGIRFGITDKNGDSYAVDSKMLGGFQAENVTGCFAMAKEIGVPLGVMLNSIHTFGGIKRRMEKRFENERVTILDDIAHSPEKASVILRDMRTIYGNETKILAIFEPNIGGRSAETAVKYTGAFSSADGVIIPRLTKLKIDKTGQLQPMDGKDLSSMISRSHSNVLYQPNDEILVQDLANLAAGRLSNYLAPHGPSEEPEHLLIAFLGSHGFRGMIEQLIEKIK
jgi:UDP-N-acetylmuramate: L-alanyl-gamma-D-glutamyl-meso-diaminopimelate ligase